jgi:DIS3-like exonuclease 2
MDDAISCILLPGSDEIAEVGVHIADVTYFLQQGSPLDEIAKQRATTVYLVESSISMLPRILCDTLCSLTPHEDRFTVSVIWKVNIKTGEFLNEKPWIGRTIIRSCVKMDYGTAQKMIEGKFDPELEKLDLDPSHPEHTTEKVRQDVIALDRVAKLLRKRRYENGALGLSTVKLSFVFDRTQPPTAGKLSVPVSCYAYETKDSNHLIEEFAILANSCVAERIVEAYPDHALIRYHESPRPDLMEEYVRFCENLGISIDYSSPGALHRSIQAAADPNDPYKVQVLQLLATKAFRQARYACTGTGGGGEKQNFHHFALSTSLYTHFTSPIRRYADVVVHRLLLSALQSAESPPIEQQEVEKIAKNCNDKKTKSMRVQEDCDFLYLCTMLNQRPSKEVAVVIGLNKNSFEVLLPRFGETQLIYMEDYPNIIVQSNFDSKNKKLCLGIAEDYLLEVESSQKSGDSIEDNRSPTEDIKGNRKDKDKKKKNRNRSRNKKQKEGEKPKKKIGKWLELKVFSRLEVEARGEYVGSGKKLDLKIRALF